MIFKRCHQCPLNRSKGSVLCPYCQAALPWSAHPIQPMAGYAPFDYDKPISEWLWALKFNHQLPMGKLLATLFTQALRKHQQPLPDIIIPAPLHPKRLRQRGFNQTAILAKHISKQLNIKYDKYHCTRIKHCRPQMKLSASERRQNIKQAFYCDMDLTGLTVVILDDVITTGSTLTDMARAIKKAGAGHVTPWAICRVAK